MGEWSEQAVKTELETDLEGHFKGLEIDRTGTLSA
jgi:hypothetical protein